MSGSVSRKHFARLGLGTAGLAVSLLASGTAFAQDAADSGTPQSTSVQTDGETRKGNEIIVTGSRVGHSTFDTTSPVTVLGQEEIDNLNLNNVGEVVAQLPANSNFFAPNNVGLGNFNVGAQLVNLRGLNPFFGAAGVLPSRRRHSAEGLRQLPDRVATKGRRPGSPATALARRTEGRRMYWRAISGSLH